MSDYVWLTEASETFLKRDYLSEGESVDERVNVICNAAERLLNKPGFAAAFKENIKKGWYSLSTPIWINFGNDRGLPISCFGSYIPDDTKGIAYTHAETMLMTKGGGGTSSYFGALRGRGEKIRKNGNSSGSVHFMQMFDLLINVISQGKARRGNFAAYLPIDHKDIYEFLAIRSDGNAIQDLFIGITVTDQWMEEMIAGDIEKRKVWAKVLECRANFGQPYIIFIDNANHGAPEVYRDRGLKISHSNLCCVTGDQRVVSDRGLLTAKELYEQGGELTLFDGYKPVKASAMRLISASEEVFKITLSNKITHTVTACHKVQTDKGMVRADELMIDDKIAIQCNKGLFGNNNADIWQSDEATQREYVLKNRDGADLLILKLNLGMNDEKYAKIVSIEKAGYEPVYCCEVYTEEHCWVCNGVQTHNSEIMLPDNEEESFVCDLSSMNILRYDEWKNTNAVELLVYFLDAVMTEFIEKAEKIVFMERAVRFAKRHRALGIGWIGWHSYLQSKMIPYESMEAKYLNIEVAKTIHGAAYAASRKMAQEYGEPEVCKGYGRRNTTLLANAPTKSSAFIIGQVSETSEPHHTNFEVKDLQKGKFTMKNPHLQKLLAEKGRNDDETWMSILKHGGSVQHLDFLTDHEKKVFKTFGEISQKEIVIQAAARQKYIDQGQSLNLMIHPSVPLKEVNALMIEAWRLGVKSLYYQFSVNAAQEFARNITTCSSCSA